MTDDDDCERRRYIESLMHFYTELWENHVHICYKTRGMQINGDLRYFAEKSVLDLMAVIMSSRFLTQ